MVVSKKQHPLTPNAALIINQSPLEKFESYCYLGIWLSRNHDIHMGVQKGVWSIVSFYDWCQVTKLFTSKCRVRVMLCLHLLAIY